MWIFYGVLIRETPILVANGVYLGCNVYLLQNLAAHHRAPPAPASFTRSQTEACSAYQEPQAESGDNPT